MGQNGTNTPTRYHITTKPAPLPDEYTPAEFDIMEGGNYIKYGHAVFAGKSVRGDDYWTAEIITQTWYMAETGRIPISGAGYGGKFAGEGFEGMWLDMSEIVRPTRDGIHGREYISTKVELGGRPAYLSFDESGGLIPAGLRTLTLNLPVIFAPLPEPLPSQNTTLSLIDAADELGTLAILSLDDFRALGIDLTGLVGLRIAANQINDLPDTVPYIELMDVFTSSDVTTLLTDKPESVIGALLWLDSDTRQQALDAVQAGVHVLHLMGDEIGMTANGDYLPDSIRDVHNALVGAAVRDQVTIIVSGGIAAAEHVAKAIACGADLVATDFIPMIAWGSSLWADKGITLIVDEHFDRDWGRQRMVNLMNAWRDQLLEALGAMGLREVRRLRGEIGRTIWHKTEEAAFIERMGDTRPKSDYPTLPTDWVPEGDFRWPVWLLHTTQQMARSGDVPSGETEFRVGDTDGGFDRLAFDFEFDRDPADVLEADPAKYDLSIVLNKRDDGRPERTLPLPWYGAGMSYGSIGYPVMYARFRAAAELGTLSSTGEGGYPDSLLEFEDHIITQVATGLFGVNEATLQRTPVIEIKYAQGAKPGLGGHLLGNKNTESVAKIRETVQGTSLFSPFPFHSVYSVEDHKKHVDWLKQSSEKALVSVKVSTPTDVDMVAVGSYYAGAHIVHLDGAYGGTGAAPEIAKKNIAMPIEYAIPKVHQFLVQEGIRDEVTLMASGGLRTAYDVAKAIALGADGAILGTSELVAIGCIRVAQCEKGLGCPFGITTTDPEHAKLVDPQESWQRIVNMYRVWSRQLAGILAELRLSSIAELRGRSDLLVYLTD